ncbi:MAG: retropepsin-like aspartic protease [Cyanobacteria bacterium J06629_19]
MIWYPYQTVAEDPKVPLAPVLQVTLLNPKQNDNRTYELNAILDTGADGTLIPLEVVSVLRLKLQAERVPITGVGGALTMGFSCWVNLQIGAIEVPLVKVASCEATAIGGQGQMIIGRDILNLFCMTFDGKQQRFSFESESVQTF